jgi:hypothetical protein
LQWIGYACSYIQSDGSWRVPLSIQCLGGAFLFIGSFITPESPRSVILQSHDDVLMTRFLVDTDREVEGLRVIADFQGKPLDHEDVLLEYKEIRDAVLLDVSCVLCVLRTELTCSERWEIDLIQRFGDDTGLES